MPDKNASWRTLIEEAMKYHDESFKDVVACTLTNEEMDTAFYCGYGGTEGVPFTLWTERRVYFPACYDGAEWVESAPRFPCDERTGHVGGG